MAGTTGGRESDPESIIDRIAAEKALNRLPSVCFFNVSVLPPCGHKMYCRTEGNLKTETSPTITYIEGPTFFLFLTFVEFLHFFNQF